ncbi:MAG: aldehyde dehydrogenase family protein [Dermatophilus congolensis]|nr:aldehyde dehydrogenase family protein [Dermatophilus congolensis]
MRVGAEQRWGKDLVAELNNRYRRGVAVNGDRKPIDRGTEPPQRQPAERVAETLAADRRSPEAQAASDLAQARQMLERARWAARAYAEYGKAAVDHIVRAAAEAGAAQARTYAEQAVHETGFGVVEHKEHKNVVCSVGLIEHYAHHDFVTSRVDQAAKIVEVARPAGVVLALTPSTNPVATVYFKALLALMTRNAVVICPHPMAKGVCTDAARTLARAAEEAGAPSGVVQVVENPSIPLLEALMADERVGAIVATGGTGVVRAAYSSGNPALGVGPGNVPVLVDGTADVRAAAKRIVDSKAFDNSVLCTNESVLIVEESVADALLREMQSAGAHLLSPGEVDQLRAHMFPMGRLNTEVVGRAAADIARAAGIKTGPRTRLLLAPIDAAVPEEAMTHEKLSPVLAVLQVPDAARGIVAARSIVRIAGAGHSAAIHSTDADTIMQFTVAVPVLRVSVNVGNSTGGAGLDTNLAPSMTIGTGFVGRSALGENLEPKHLVNWARIAYGSDASDPMVGFTAVEPWSTPRGPVPVYPWPSNDPRFGQSGPPPRRASTDRLVDRVTDAVGTSGHATDEGALRAEIRRLVAAELSDILKG